MTNIHEHVPYKPRFISFYNYLGTDLEQELENLDTSNMTSMANLFYSCYNLTKLDVSKLNTSNVTDMSYMFYNVRTITELDVSNLDTSKVTNMNNMFYNLQNITQLDISNFDISNVTNMGSMFRNSDKLKTIDMGNLDFINVKDMGYIFYNCRSLETITLGENLGNVSSTTNMFYSCQKLSKLIIKSSAMLKLSNNSLGSTLIASGEGYIYVPDNLVESYKTANYWSTYASQIKGISELPV